MNSNAASSNIAMRFTVVIVAAFIAFAPVASFGVAYADDIADGEGAANTTMEGQAPSQKTEGLAEEDQKIQDDAATGDSEKGTEKTVVPTSGTTGDTAQMIPTKDGQKEEGAQGKNEDNKKDNKEDNKKEEPGKGEPQKGTSQDPVPEKTVTDPEGTPEKTEQIVVPAAAVVTVTDYENDTTYVADENGNVKIQGLISLTGGPGTGEESFVMVVDGKSYPITVYSDGSYDGRLPAGFSIKNFTIYISGVSSDLNILIKDHYAMSSIFDGPDLEGVGYFEPTVPEQPRMIHPVAAVEMPRSNSNGYTASSGSHNIVSRLVANTASEPAAAEEPEKTEVAQVSAETYTDDSEVLGVSEDPAGLPPIAIAIGIGALAVISLAGFAFSKMTAAA